MTRRIETDKAILPQTSNVGQRFSLSNLLAKLFLRDDLMKRKTILTFWKGLGCHLRVWTGICGNFLQNCNIWEQASSSIAYRVVSTPSKKKPKENFVPTTIARVPHSFEHYWRHLHGTFHLGTTIIWTPNIRPSNQHVIIFLRSLNFRCILRRSLQPEGVKMVYE
jgi:hypothetical protein